MNKKILSMVLLSSFLLMGCDFALTSKGDFVPEEKDSSSSPISEEVDFNITSATFIDANRHLKVNYTCNYDSPFDVPGHLFSKLNITGVTASELDITHNGYFTLLSPIENTTLKFEFYDSNNKVYISTRYTDVKLFDPDDIVPTIDFPEGYNTLYWSDEFTGESLDTSKWTYEIGNGNNGWGNGESQYYTNNNDSIVDGKLVITAKKEQKDNFEYTSTRIKTQNKVKFTYGYVEARISLPVVTGMWPAFWMMPNNSVYGGWPHSGEIDIMEARGRMRYISSSAIHFSNGSGHTYKTDEKSGHDISEYHKYAVSWEQDVISFYIDDVMYFSCYKSQWSTQGSSSDTAPFDQDFYIILNLAIGGHFDGYRLPGEGFTSAEMKVDYVRVFKK